MSQEHERVVFDVYGRFRVSAERRGAAWNLYVVGPDGKRGRLHDVVVPDGSTIDEIERLLEATYHEAGSPNTTISRIT